MSGKWKMEEGRLSSDQRWKELLVNGKWEMEEYNQ